MGEHIVFREGIDGTLGAFAMLSRFGEAKSLAVYHHELVPSGMARGDTVTFIDCTPSDDVLTILRACGIVRILDNQSEQGVRERFMRYLKKEGVRYRQHEQRLGIDDLCVLCLSDTSASSAQVATWYSEPPLPKVLWTRLLAVLQSSWDYETTYQRLAVISCLLVCGCDVRPDLTELAMELLDKDRENGSRSEIQSDGLESSGRGAPLGLSC